MTGEPLLGEPASLVVAVIDDAALGIGQPIELTGGGEWTTITALAAASGARREW